VRGDAAGYGGRFQNKEDEQMNVRSVVASLVLCVASTSVWAGTARIAEPGVLELLGIGAIVGAAIAIRRRRK